MGVNESVALSSLRPLAVLRSETIPESVLDKDAESSGRLSGDMLAWPDGRACEHVPDRITAANIRTA